MDRPSCDTYGTSDVGLARSLGAVLDGVLGVPIEIEVHVGSGLPAIGIVGLPGASVNEARWRIRSAVVNSGASWPDSRVTISLSPSELPKHGAGLDLPMAIAILAASGRVDGDQLAHVGFVGELALDGGVRPVRGALALVLCLARVGCRGVVVPADNAAECQALPDLDVYPISTLVDAFDVLAGNRSALGPRVPEPVAAQDQLDLGEVAGQTQARWALEVAAAGGHHVFMSGNPGVGKTMLAERFPGLLPDLDEQACMEVTAIHSVAGLAHDRMITRPPFQSPHCTASAAAIFGSVRRSAVIPGAVTLAHRGVLFLDEAAEFGRDVIEGLRQPLESCTIPIHRAGWLGVLPANVQMILAVNPCPCGYFTHPDSERCTCSSEKIRAYQARISGPVRSRLDIGVHLGPHGLVGNASAEPSHSVRDRVLQARERARHRLARFGIALNSRVPAALLTHELCVAPAAESALHDLADRGLRAVHRSLRVAWTIADLRAHARPDADDVIEAAALYRGAQEVRAR